jgi:hypothetical protein
MHASMRPYATAGVALVGASVIAVTPIAPSQPDAGTVRQDVSLAAASIANVPANLIHAFLNIPAAEVAGIERLAAAMEASGSWNEPSPGNVWGWDPVNPEMLKGSIDMLLPFPALSTPLGEHINWWAAANFPMYEGCAFECPDPIGMLNRMFRVPIWEFYDEDGYTFGPPITPEFNPIGGEPVPWFGQTVKLDPFEPIQSVIDYLLNDPGEVTFPAAYEIITAVANFAAALQTTEQLAAWIPVREVEAFLKLFVPGPETSSVPESEQSGQISTLNTAALQEDLGNEMGSLDAEQGSTVGDLVGKLDGTGGEVQQDVLAAGEVPSSDAKQGGLAVDDVLTTPDADAPRAVPSTNVLRESLKVEPGQSGPTHRMPSGGGLAGAVKSVQDTIKNITGGLTGDSTNSSEASTGDTTNSDDTD